MKNVQVIVKQADFGYTGLGYKHEDFKRDVSCYREEKLVKIVKDNLDKYPIVAIMTLEGELHEMLNDAYRLTNSVEEAWYTNPELLQNGLVDVPEEGCRSTSVGDIISVDGVDYMVDGFGFKAL